MPETGSIIRTALLLIVGPGVINGQTTSGHLKTIHIAGRVVDSNGATIPKAPVTLRSARLGETAATTQTDNSGKFAFAAAPARRYELFIQTPPETEQSRAYFKSLLKMVDAGDEKDIDTGDLCLCEIVSVDREPPVAEIMEIAPPGPSAAFILSLWMLPTRPTALFNYRHGK